MERIRGEKEVADRLLDLLQAHHDRTTRLEPQPLLFVGVRLPFCTGTSTHTGNISLDFALHPPVQALVQFDPLMYRHLPSAASEDDVKTAHEHTVSLVQRGLREMNTEGVRLLHRNHTVVEAAGALHKLQRTVLGDFANADMDSLHPKLRTRMSVAQAESATALLEEVKAHLTAGPAQQMKLLSPLPLLSPLSQPLCCLCFRQHRRHCCAAPPARVGRKG